MGSEDTRRFIANFPDGLPHAKVAKPAKRCDRGVTS
jgi:hypothetical protein